MAYIKKIMSLFILVTFCLGVVSAIYVSSMGSYYIAYAHPTKSEGIIEIGYWAGLLGLGLGGAYFLGCFADFIDHNVGDD